MRPAALGTHQTSAVHTDPFPIDYDDPQDCASFFKMVELYYDKAATLLEPTLIAELKSRESPEMKTKRVKGILSMIKRVIE